MIVILHFAVLSAYFTMLLKWLCEYSIALSLQCFDTVGWATGRVSNL